MADLSEETANNLSRAIERLTDKMSDMGSSMGRGNSSPLPGRGKGKDKDAGSLPNEELEKMKKRLKALNDELDAAGKLNDKEFKEREELIKKTKDLTGKTEKAADSYKDLERGLKSFGKGLLTGKGDAAQAFDGLSSTLSNSSSKIGNVLGGFAGGVSFMLQALTGFADDARQLGGFADLGAFKIGSIKQAKLMSGLGESFIKTIELSQGGFKAFGSNSQESVEALSELARGFRVGSSVISRSLARNLGPELTKTMDRAQRATAAMGLSQEDQAAVMGSLSQTISLTAKSEKEAQQMMVKQYAATTEAARTLSNTFGASAKDILKAMNEFRSSMGGQAAAAMGLDVEGANLAAMMQQMGVALDPDKMSRVATLLAMGDEGQARAIVNPEQQQTMDSVIRAMRAAQGMEGGLANAQNLQSGARGEIGALREQFEQRRGMLSDAAYADPAIRAKQAAERMTLQQQAEAGDAEAKRKLEAQGTTTEAGNITAMNKLTDALNSLRNVIIGLTAGVVALVGILPAVLGAGGIGAVLSGGLGGKLLGGIGEKLGGMLSKVPGLGKLGAGGAAKAGGSAVMDKMAGAVGSGLSSFGEMLGKLGDNKTVKGAGTIALLGAALALAAHGFKTFGEVKWEGMLKGTVALGGLIAIARLVGEATTSMVKGAAGIAILGAALLLSAIGFKTFNEVNWDSLVKGALAIGVLAVAAKIIGNMSTDLFKGALAIGVLGATMWVAGKGFAAFNEVNWSSVVKGALAMGVLGIAAMALGKIAPQVLIGALAIAVLGGAMWIAGKGFASFNDVDWSALLKGTVALGVLTAAVFALGALMLSGVGAALFVAGIAALVGLGVAAAALGVGLGIASMGMKPFAEGLKSIADIDGANLIAVGAGLAAIGAGMAVFALGMLAGTASGVISGIASLFGVKSPLDKVKEFVPMADKIALVGEGIKNFGDGILSLNKGVSEFNKDAFDNLKTSMQEFAIAGSSEEMRLTAEYLKSIGESLGSISQIESLPSTASLGAVASTVEPGSMTAGITTLPEGSTPTATTASTESAQSAMSPEMVTSMMSYLSSIQNDIAAIRGNTKPNDSSAPVRLG
jgi:hypothetical protein